MLTAMRLKWLCFQFCVTVNIDYAVKSGFMSRYIHYKFVEQENLLVALVTIDCGTLVYDHLFV